MFLILGAVIILLPSCGLLSLRRDAMSLWMDALEISGMGMPTTSEEPAPMDREKMLLALEKAEEAIAIDPLFQPAHRLAIDLAHLLGDEEKTLAGFRYALALFPDDTQLRLVYARFLMIDAQSPEEALVVIESGLRRDPRDLALRMAHLEMLADQGDDWDAVEREIRDTLRMEDLPDNLCARMTMLAVILGENGHMESASRTILRLAERSREGLKLGMGMTLEAGHGEGAEDLFRYVEANCEVPPRFYTAWIRLLILRNKTEEAQKLLEDPLVNEAVEKSGEGESRRILEGFLLLVRGDAEASKGVFESVLDKTPDSLDALEGLFSLHLQHPEVVDRAAVSRRFRKALRLIEDPEWRRILIGTLAGIEQGAFQKDQEPDPSGPPGKSDDGSMK